MSYEFIRYEFPEEGIAVITLDSGKVNAMSAALVADGGVVLSNVIATQLDLLKKYGGVLISRRGDIIGIVTKADLIYY